MTFDSSIIDKYAIKKKIEEGLNWEKIPRTPNGQIELRYETYGSTKKTEIDVNEFICEGLDIAGDTYPFVTTQYCEDKALGKGCKEIKTCPYYKKQKEFEKKHTEINWEEITKNLPEQINRIKFIKTGAIIEKWTHEAEDSVSTATK